MTSYAPVSKKKASKGYIFTATYGVVDDFLEKGAFFIFHRNGFRGTT